MEGGKVGLMGDGEVMMAMDMTEGCYVDWEHILDDVPDHGLLDACLWDDGVGVGPTGSVESWLGDVEHLLFDGDDSDKKSELKGDEMELQVDDFQVCELLLVDEPQEEEEHGGTGSEDGLEGEDERSRLSSEDGGLEERNPVTCSYSDRQDLNGGSNNPSPNSNSNPDDHEIDGALDSKDDDDSPDNDDPLSKKRKRQLRNRDAAMRSRERKKMYVKDLEAKSRYLESECRRLGRLLQCCYAENQMLRFSVHSGTTFGDSMAKPESAVLLPETLPLVSLVWLMVLMCLHPLASLLLLSQDAVVVANVNRKEAESAARPRVKGGKAIKVWPLLSYLRSKGCKGSRTKMKCHFDSSMQHQWFGNTPLSHSTIAIC